MVKLNLGDLGQVMVLPSSNGCVRSISLSEDAITIKFRNTIDNIFFFTREKYFCESGFFSQNMFEGHAFSNS